MKLGVVGGTFDPVHDGHLIIAEAAREQLSLDRVAFVPAGQPWRKADRAITPAGHRLAMLQLACRCNDSFQISTLDVERAGPSYTVDTLQELHEAQPDAEIFFVLGEDALADLPNWKSPERIYRLATLAVAGRAADVPLVEAQHDQREHTERAIIRLNSPLVSISASDIRRRVRQGTSIRYLVPAEVEQYIVQHGLYKE